MSYILIVEDDVDNAEILVRYLAMENLNSKHLSNGRDVLHLVQADTPDLILMDVNLPDDDGRVLCRSIKNQLGQAAPPVILMTAALDLNADTILKFGADDYLRKPFLQPKLIKKISQLLTPSMS